MRFPRNVFSVSMVCLMELPRNQQEVASTLPRRCGSGPKSQTSLAPSSTCCYCRVKDRPPHNQSLGRLDPGRVPVRRAGALDWQISDRQLVTRRYFVYMYELRSIRTYFEVMIVLLVVLVLSSAMFLHACCFEDYVLNRHPQPCKVSDEPIFKLCQIVSTAPSASQWVRDGAEMRRRVAAAPLASWNSLLGCAGRSSLGCWKPCHEVRAGYARVSHRRSV